MHRPLWQIVLTLIALGFAVDRGAVAVMAHYADAGLATVVMQGTLAIAALGAALGLWLYRGASPESPDAPGGSD